MNTHYFSQAEHDGLCGFYAALNAIRHLTIDLSGKWLAGASKQELFDDAVESLARTPGTDIRVLKGNSDVGGIDIFQIRSLLVDFIERNRLPCTVDLFLGDQSFSALYKDAWRRGEHFAMIVCYRNGTHWVTAARRGENDYWLIDNSQPEVRKVDARISPQLSGTACLLTWNTSNNE